MAFVVATAAGFPIAAASPVREAVVVAGILVTPVARASWSFAAPEATELVPLARVVAPRLAEWTPFASEAAPVATERVPLARLVAPSERRSAPAFSVFAPDAALATPFARAGAAEARVVAPVATRPAPLDA